jgi:hypothetical protein
MPITLTVKEGTFEENIVGLTTDQNGYFTARIQRSTDDGRTWRVKGPQNLSVSGTFDFSPGSYEVDVEMGLLRTGDCNDDNRVTIQDVAIMKATFGKAPGDPGYDPRGDLDGDGFITLTDYNLLRSNFGSGGSPPILPGRK